MRFRKRKYTVVIDSPDRTEGFTYEVRARDKEDARRRATYYWFKNCPEGWWYEWHFEVIA